MKPQSAIRNLLAALGCAALSLCPAHAVVYYWDSNGTTAGFGNTDGIWGSSAFWSTSPAGTTATANSTITSLDDINFGTVAYDYSGTVTLNANRIARSMALSGSSAVVMKGNGTARTLALGSGGLILNDTATLTLGDGVAGNNLLINLGAVGQTWINNTSNNLTIPNTAATFSRSAGGTIRFDQVGAGEFSMSTTVLPNDATGIVGPWAFFGSGTNTRFAFNNSGTITGYTAGTAATDADEFSNSATNYDFASTGTTTLTDSRSANTVRYTGTGNVIDLGSSGSNSLTANAILAAGSSGTLTIQRTGGTGTLVAGSTGTNSELIIAGPQDVNLTAPVSNGSGNSTLTYSGTGTISLAGDNTYSGGTRMNSGTLIANSSTALGASGSSLGVIGTLDINGFSFNAGAFNGDSASAIVTNSAPGPAQDFIVGTGNAGGNFAGSITGNLHLVKSGTGTLSLGNANTYSGGTTLNGGMIDNLRANSLGTGTITFAGNAELRAFRQGSDVWDNAVHINAGAKGQINAINQFFRFSTTGVLSGEGTLWVTATDNGAGNIIFSNTANTFTGTVEIGNPTKSGTLQISSLPDSANPIKLGATTGTGTLILTGTAAPQLYTNRQVELTGTSGGGTITNNGATDNIVTFAKDLAVVGTGNKTFTLGGSNTGENAFNGLIANGTGSVISLTKAGGGIWIIGNPDNTHTGITTIGGGILHITKLADGGLSSSIGASDNAAGNLLFSTGSTLLYTGPGHSSDRGFTINGTAAGHQATINSSGTGPLNLTGSITPGYGTTNQTRTLNLRGSNTGENTLAAEMADNGSGAVSLNKNDPGTWLLTGSSTRSGVTDVIAGSLGIGHDSALGTGILNLGGTNSNTPTIFASGAARIIANNTVLLATSLGGNPTITGSQDLTINGTTTASGAARTLTVNNSGLTTLAGNVFLSNDNTTSGRGLTINGTGNTVISGVIANNSGANTLAATLTKNGTGILELTGNNTYTGLTTVNAGTLLVNNTTGSGTGAGAVAVFTNGTLGGGGTIAGNVAVVGNASLAPGASVGTLTINGNLDLFPMSVGAGNLKFDLGPIAASDRIVVGGNLDLGGFVDTPTFGLSSFTFTNLGGLQTGTYDLISYGGTLDGFLNPADQTGAIGGFDATLQIDAAAKKVQLILVNSGATPYDTWSGGAPFDGDANGDGVSNGLAFLLGADGPNDNALGLLPTVTESGGNLVLSFDMLKPGNRGAATLGIEHSRDLGIADAWTTVAVPDSNGGPTSGVTFVVGTGAGTTNPVTATISASEANGTGKLFGRLKAENP